MLHCGIGNGGVGQSKAGKPNSSGWKSSSDLSTRVAFSVIWGSILSSGTMTTCIPAARPALTPFGASSNTKHCGTEGYYIGINIQMCWNVKAFETLMFGVIFLSKLGSWRSKLIEILVFRGPQFDFGQNF